MMLTSKVAHAHIKVGDRWSDSKHFRRLLFQNVNKIIIKFRLYRKDSMIIIHINDFLFSFFLHKLIK